MELVGAFGSLRDAELAARFLTERGLATKAMELATPAMEPTDPTPCSERRRSLTRPLMYAAFGAIPVGFVGNVLWKLLLPDVDYAAKLLRWAGGDRVLVRDDTC